MVPGDVPEVCFLDGVLQSVQSGFEGHPPPHPPGRRLPTNPGTLLPQLSKVRG
jgi:hypothetical protein